MKNRKILIIDDEPHVLKLCSLILSREGYQVVEASNGAEAIAKVEKDPPDLIIVDLMLPDMNGAEIIQAIREKHSCRAPVLFLTAMITRAEEVAKDLDIKVQDVSYQVMAKPLDQTKFLELVKKQLG
ncbi:MAG: response regulator [Candidatus Omnitrophota bacterium]|nr:response regulator [Candidatus Omnitrophota bacterium]